MLNGSSWNYDVDEAVELSKTSLMIKNSRRHNKNKLSSKYE